MKTIDLGEGLLCFMFDPPPGEFEGLNLLALVDGGEALLLDTGYKENLREALGHLESIGARPTKAIISHYHSDHADGLALLPGLETWGHAAYQETLDRCFRPERHASLAPRHAISAPEALAFGGHRLELIPMPGHTPDSLSVAIDGRVMYAADLLLFTNEGAPVLPSVHARPVSLHADALRKLWNYLGMTFVPGHGAPVMDRTTRERDLANRISYVEAIATRPGIGLDEARRLPGHRPDLESPGHRLAGARRFRRCPKGSRLAARSRTPLPPLPRRGRGPGRGLPLLHRDRILQRAPRLLGERRRPPRFPSQETRDGPLPPPRG